MQEQHLFQENEPCPRAEYGEYGRKHGRDLVHHRLQAIARLHAVRGVQHTVNGDTERIGELGKAGGVECVICRSVAPRAYGRDPGAGARERFDRFGIERCRFGRDQTRLNERLIRT